MMPGDEVLTEQVARRIEVFTGAGWPGQDPAVRLAAGDASEDAGGRGAAAAIRAGDPGTGSGAATGLTAPDASASA